MRDQIPSNAQLVKDQSNVSVKMLPRLEVHVIKHVQLHLKLKLPTMAQAVFVQEQMLEENFLEMLVIPVQMVGLEHNAMLNAKHPVSQTN
jgi:hypothetical protein